MRREICGECGAPINDDGSCICTEFLKRGWRKCAGGQKTTQWCAMAESARGELRDYFAAKFAAAMMTATSSDHNYPNIDYQRDVGGPTVAERVATIAYRMADAMLRAREASNDHHRPD